MHASIGGHQAVSDTDFLELALGTPLELWLGVKGENEQERAARLAAARDILAENLDMPTEALRVAAEAIESRTEQLVNVVALARPATTRTRTRAHRAGVAA
ncbi:hypothetical protein ACX6XY_14990 [Streptomyces sp. O3]